MILEINVEKLKEVGLTPSEYCFLIYHRKGIEFPFEIPPFILLALQSAGWIKFEEGNVILRDKFLNLIKIQEETINVPSWINEYRDLWPEGVKSGGRPIRGDTSGCITKMQAFVNQHKSVTKEDILEVTKMYIFEKARSNYAFMSCADYFIKKDGLSILAGLLEDVTTREEFRRNQDGGSSFHKQI